MTIHSLKIVGIGDSTTAGTPQFRSPLESPPDGRGNPESQYSFWMMKLHPDWEVLNRGINGQRSDEILERFQRDVVLEKPDYVIVLAGVNDVYQGRSVESVKSNLTAMYSAAVGASIRLVGATILPYDTMGMREVEAIRELNRWIRENAKGIRILFCDTNAAVAHPAIPNMLRGSPDGLHPGVLGYRIMGERLARTIEEDQSAPSFRTR